jgi:Family of unknown function (DUF5681)
LESGLLLLTVKKHNADHMKATRFLPGQSGNPTGRPKSKPITDRYREALEVLLPEDVRKKLMLKKGATMGDAIARKMAVRAVNGVRAVDAAREMREAIEGRAPQALRIQSQGTVRFVVDYVDNSKTIDGDAEYIDDGTGSNG